MTVPTARKPTVLLEYHLKQLKLPTMLREYAPMASVCSKERTDYPTYLLRLTERELIDRERRAAERRIKAAKFPVIKTLDSFDFSAQPSINETVVRQLMSGEYIDRRENVLLVGNSGTGKTHLASALGFSACSQGRRVRFFTVTGLVIHLLEAREDRKLERLLKHLQRHHVLVLDELGSAPRGAKTPCRVRDPTRSRCSGSMKLRAGEASAWTLNRQAALTT